MRHVRSLVRERGVAVLWATHLLDEVVADDAVVVLHRGRVVAAGEVSTVDRNRRSSDMLRGVHRPDRRRQGRSRMSVPTRPSSRPRSRGFTASASISICLRGIVWREALRFVHQRGRFVSAIVRPLVWLFIFAAGFRQILGVSIIPPYETYVLYEVYVTPGLMAMIQLFNGMQSSLSMVYDREMGNMRMLLVSPFPRWFLLLGKLLASTSVSILQVFAYLLIAWLWGSGTAVGLPRGHSRADPVRHDAGRAGHAAVVVHQAARELCRRDELRDIPDVLRLLGAVSAVAGAAVEPGGLFICRLNPFTYAVELIRFALYVEVDWMSLAVVCWARRSCSRSAPSSPMTRPAVWSRAAEGQA